MVRFLFAPCFCRFLPVQMKALLRQLLEILAFIHENKYVHRDIKCSNLLINNNLQLKVRLSLTLWAAAGRLAHQQVSSLHQDAHQGNVAWIRCPKYSCSKGC